jgi:hypothetical protein
MIHLVPLLSAAWAAHPRPLLVWEVEKGDRRSWVMGTCHFPLPVEHALPKPYDRHLTNARVFVSEMDVQAMLEPLPLLKLLLRPDYDLRTVIGEDAFKALAAHLPALPAPMLVRMEPWVAATSTQFVSPAGEGQPQGTVAPLDLALTRRAEAAGVRLVYLETLEQQLSMMAGLNDTFAEGLVPGSTSAEAAARLTNQMSALCLNGDLDALAAVLAEQNTGDFLVALLDRRNKTWHNVLMEQVDLGNAFFAVGAGHLVGPTGLLAQLEQEGWALTRLTTKRPPSSAEAAGVPTFRPIAPFVPDPEKAARYHAALGPMNTPLCAPQGPGACVVAPETCVARFTEASALCIDQQLATLPDEPSEEALTGLAGCAIGSLAIEGLVSDYRGAESPTCDGVRAGMLEAMDQALDGF